MHPTHGLSYSSQSEIAIAYANLESFENISHLCPHIVTKISIIHSKLQSLRGIQKFTQITHLNLKFNNLEHADELMRIPTRSILRQLNLEGNSIEYYASCTFLALKRSGFDSLVMLNNKDYSKWNQRRQKQPNIQKINTKISEMEKSMSKTLKRTIRNNVIQKYKLSNQLEPEHNPQQQEPTSRETSKYHTGSSQERTPFRQISLSNVNIRKSVKEEDYPNEKSKVPQLFIEPIQFLHDDQIVHMPLTQPTATFASQKQKDCMPFKGRNHFSHQINVVSEVDDNFTSEDDEIYEISYYTNNGNRQSFSRTRQMRDNLNKSALQEMYDSVTERGTYLADAFYRRNLIEKTLKAIKIYRPSFNLPRKVPYV